MTIELDEAAVEAAGKALVNTLWDESMPAADVVVREVVTAYLAAAARPTPDAAAMEERPFQYTRRTPCPVCGSYLVWFDPQEDTYGIPNAVQRCAGCNREDNR